MTNNKTKQISFRLPLWLLAAIDKDVEAISRRCVADGGQPISRTHRIRDILSKHYGVSRTPRPSEE